MTLEPGRNTLLVLDYPGRRPEAHLADLGLEEAGFDCRYLLDGPLPEALTARQYAQELCEAANLGADVPIAVLAYCASAALAAPVARFTAGRDRTPVPIVYFDPSECHLHDLIRSYTDVARQVSGTAQDEDRELDPPLVDLAVFQATPEALIQKVTADLEMRARDAFVAGGFAPDEVSEAVGNVVGVYVKYIAHLVAMRHHDAPPEHGDAVQVVSRDQPEQATWLGISPGRTIRAECTRQDLARDDAVREAVIRYLDLVASAAPARM